MNSPQRSLFDTAPDPWELDAAEQKLIADIVFPEPPFGPYSYLIPEQFAGSLKPGQRVLVPLGNQREKKPGYCVKVEARAVGQRRLRPIAGLIDQEPLLSNSMLRLTEWMADYYLAPWGQVLQGVVPSGVRGQAGTREMTFLSVPEKIKGLVQQATANDSLASIKPTSRVKLSPDIIVTGTQLSLLAALLASPRPLTPPELAEAVRCSTAPIEGLRKKHLVEAHVRRIQQLEIEEVVTPREEHLSLQEDQQRALAAIVQPLRERQHATILIHGITGSGKTEVYIRAIEEVISFGRQAIVLVPEISLTPQTRERFRSRFANVAVLHSHLSDAERHWHWQRIARGEIQVVVGARSAVFAPTPHLGLIILDEEHDGSFKQSEAPRYHAREVALQRAKGEQVPLVLGSATPALESWQRALTDEFRLVEMLRRVSNRPMPPVETIDLREARGGLSRGAISRPLERAMKESLAEGGQVILLLNRRGYSTHIQCPACGFVVKCDACDVPLTHHREEEKVRCHYCDFVAQPPLACPNCRFDGIRYGGMGTERLEGELKAKFPDVSLLRMDSDTMQKPGSHEIALEQFRSGQAKILLGTQMIAKGLDFPNVTLVGVVNADSALHFNDFRAAERTFQLVTQVAGRTGRGDKLGRVLVQTYSPEHPAIQAAQRHDYRMFAFFELPLRKEFHYPPYATLIRMIVRGDLESKVQQYIENIVVQLRQALIATAGEHRLLGPTPCAFAKLRGKFRYHLLAMAPDGEALKNAFRSVLQTLPANEEVQWVVDVDPVDLL